MEMSQASSATLDFSIVVPAHDEAENIAPYLEEINTALEGKGEYEVLWVDDGSRDDTLSRLMAEARRFSRLRIVRHRRRCGQSAAIATGVGKARASVIVTLDGDRQNDPADIPRLLEVFRGAARESAPQLVTGYRRRRQDAWLKRITSRVANAVRARLLRDRTPDTGCGLKVFGRDAFLALPAFDHMHRFLPALFLRQGGTVLSVEVNHRQRLHGRTHYGTFDRLWVGIVDLLGVMWLLRRTIHPEVEEITGSET
jgi:glycosyltransferase involved in cell wall biosynthesis